MTEADPSLASASVESLFERSGALLDGHILLKSGRHAGRDHEKFLVLQHPAIGVELYNPADIFAWLMEAAKDAPAHLIAADELAGQEELVEGTDGDDWEAELPPSQQETLAAQRLWQLADAYRAQLGAAQAQILREFSANAEEVLRRTGDLSLLEEADDILVLRADGRFETSLDLSDRPREVLADVEARRSGLAVTEARVIAEFYDPADVLHWVHEALAERYPAVDFSAVYE